MQSARHGYRLTGMSLIRTYIQSLDPESLSELWRESKSWDDKGVLPLDAKVREHVRLALPDLHGSFTLVADRLFSEVWREMYVRTDALYASAIAHLGRGCS